MDRGWFGKKRSAPKVVLCARNKEILKLNLFESFLYPKEIACWQPGNPIIHLCLWCASWRFFSIACRYFVCGQNETKCCCSGPGPAINVHIEHVRKHSQDQRGQSKHTHVSLAEHQFILGNRQLR